VQLHVLMEGGCARRKDHDISFLRLWGTGMRLRCARLLLPCLVSGRFGGKYVPETLIPALSELEVEYKKAIADPKFKVGGTNTCTHT